MIFFKNIAKYFLKDYYLVLKDILTILKQRISGVGGTGSRS